MNNETKTQETKAAKQTLKPKRQKKLSEKELRDLIVKETRESIEGKFNQYINLKLYWLSKSNWDCKDLEIQKILDLYAKMYEVLKWI